MSGEKRVGLALVVAIFAISACTLGVEESESGDRSLQRLEDMDAGAARELYDWYILQGINPCIPPPDPWHPFAKYGYCENVDFDAVPNQSYDE